MVLTSIAFTLIPAALAAQANPDLPGCTTVCTAYCPVGEIIVTAPYPLMPTPNSKLPITNYCYWGICDVQCGLTVASRALVPGIVAAVEAGDIRELERVVSSHSETVTVNRDRQAIQLAGCSAHELVASVPVPLRVFAALEHALAPDAQHLAVAETNDSDLRR